MVRIDVKVSEKLICQGKIPRFKSCFNVLVRLRSWVSSALNTYSSEVVSWNCLACKCLNAQCGKTLSSAVALCFIAIWLCYIAIVSHCGK